MDCSIYRVDVPDGTYKVSLYFVEPQLKSKEKIIFNLKYDVEQPEENKQRIFDILLNDQLITAKFNMANEYPDRYGIIKSVKINIKNSEGLTIRLHPIVGQTVISGILIEKLN